MSVRSFITDKYLYDRSLKQTWLGILYLPMTNGTNMAAVENRVVQLTVQPMDTEVTDSGTQNLGEQKKKRQPTELSQCKKIELACVYEWHTYCRHVAYTSTDYHES
jgi:hypothetical protein